MALLTIVSTVSQIGTRAFDLGLWPTLLAVSLWFLAVVLSLACAVVIPYMMMIHQRHLLEGTTASLLLPVVPPITAAATGAGLVEILTRSHPSLAFTVLTISYIVRCQEDVGRGSLLIHPSYVVQRCRPDARSDGEQLSDFASRGALTSGCDRFWCSTFSACCSSSETVSLCSTCARG
jgi:hypothetical protein